MTEQIIITIDPFTAEQLLRKRGSNQRLIEMDRAFLYADQMRLGLWNNDQSAIMLDMDGNLINGQHRMLALVIAQMPGVFPIELVHHGEIVHENCDNARTCCTNNA